jgi:hypothetical protein
MVIEIYDKEETTPINKECEGDEMTDTSEEEQTMPWPTPRSKVGSNDVNMTPSEIILCSTFGAEFDDAIEIHSKWNLKTK